MKLVLAKDFIRRNFPPGGAPHINTVRRHIRDGQLPGRRIGARYYIDEAAIEGGFSAIAEKVIAHVRRAS